MKAVLKVSRHFDYSDPVIRPGVVKDRELFERHLLEFYRRFPQSSFYYHIKAYEADRYFVIETDTDSRDSFIDEVNLFAELLGWTILNRPDSAAILRKIEADNLAAFYSIKGTEWERTESELAESEI